MKLRSIAFILLALGCTRNDISAFWQVGGKYELKLALSGEPPLTPEQQRYFNPRVDTATLILTVDSIVGSTADGKVAGDTRHFPVSFQAVNRNRFSAVRSREHWAITINPDATDTGLALDGELSHGVIAGKWETRSSSRSRGQFHLAPTT
jgi:hypothetical protein